MAAFDAEPRDSVLVLGRTRTLAGQMVLEGGLGRRLRQGMVPPEPASISSASVSGAEGGLRASEFLRLAAVEVLEVRVSFGDLVVTVTDGSGPAVARFPTGFLAELRVESLDPGTVLDIQGLLLPAISGGTWEVRPRLPTDLIGLDPAP